VAYAEKRGKGPAPWRVKYKLPNGTDTSESGFGTKTAALTWGRDQEARIREGRWTDPSAGKITVSEWIDRWLAIQDVDVSTQANREYLIRRFLRPAWVPASWTRSAPSRSPVGERPARQVGRLPAHGQGCAQPAVHDPGRRGVDQALPDPVQPCAPPS
jgi:hypothetical protein